MIEWKEMEEASLLTNIIYDQADQLLYLFIINDCILQQEQTKFNCTPGADSPGFHGFSNYR
jgi:hypothetical protein